MLIFPPFILSKHLMHICIINTSISSSSMDPQQIEIIHDVPRESLFVCKDSWKSICNKIQQLKRRSNDNKRKECTQNWQYFILNDVQRSMNFSNKKPQKYVLPKHVDIFIDYFSLHLKSKHMFFKRFLA